jgi:hypothetical protein
MVRPKASRENIRTSIVFADMVTFNVRQDSSDEPSGLVPHTGKYSIYSAFSLCFPELARDSQDKSPKNRRGVALVELNKALNLAGLQIERIKERKGDSGNRHTQVFIFH